MASFKGFETVDPSSNRGSNTNDTEAEIPSWYLPQNSPLPTDYISPLYEWHQQGSSVFPDIHDYTWPQIPDPPCTPNSALLGWVDYGDCMNKIPPNVSLPNVAESSKNELSLGDAGQQKCHYPDCPDERVFQQSSALKKHMDRHFRPYKCQVLSCKVTDFASRGDLKRHEREVHTPPSLVCHIISCKRHRRGFSRKDNLVQHMKRAHNQEDFGDMTASADPTMSPIHEVARKSAVVGEKLIVLGTSTMPVAATIENASSSEKTRLAQKLQELEMEKAKFISKFDGDIEALKRVLSFM